MKKTLSLYELNTLVGQVIESTMPNAYWVEAEVSEAREHSGHLYLELIEKDDRTHTPIARASAKCWRTTWSVINSNFQRITGMRLRTGIKLMLQVYAQFHPQYGFSWIVADVNPEYTMGDMARKRKEIIEQLKAAGIFDLQKELVISKFANRIAVISSESAAGYGDFVNQLLGNDYGLPFYTTLFPAVMQGEQVERSIIAALDSIHTQEENFDCVVIIRGGGATADLSGFDTLALAENVANFPLP
ncbi:MAG: exodeoxyribonuclease VII large subunit, partial [Prevotella sp.]|nr:exodeoxyribonuclease VII large subunit [Prevotella sp.]